MNLAARQEPSSVHLKPVIEPCLLSNKALVSTCKKSKCHVDGPFKASLLESASSTQIFRGSRKESKNDKSYFPRRYLFERCCDPDTF